MKILGLDFGLKKIGLALSYGSLAEPYLVLRGLDTGELVKKLKQICEEEKVEKIVIGVSDGEIAEKSKELGGLLEKELSIQIEFFDETLTTYDAQRLAIEAGIKRGRRRKMEDAMAAAVMLQGYIDSH